MSLGVVILEAPDLIQARFRAKLEGVDQGAAFAAGWELDDERAAPVPRVVSVACCRHTRRTS